MKNSKKVTIIELIIVIFVFVVPSYLSQDLEIDQEVFSNFRFNITYIVTMLPQIALLLLLLYLRKQPEQSFQGCLEEYGFTGFDLSLIWKTIAVFAGTFFLAFAASFIILIPALGESEYFQTVPWRITDSAVLPLVLLTCITTGYREELIFRSYFLNRFTSLGVPKIPALIVSAVLFAGGHIYQGLTAFFATFCIGLFLAAVFIRYKNIHIIALGHGLYNFFSLILFPIIVNFLI